MTSLCTCKWYLWPRLAAGTWRVGKSLLCSTGCYTSTTGEVRLRRFCILLVCVSGSVCWKRVSEICVSGHDFTREVVLHLIQSFDMKLNSLWLSGMRLLLYIPFQMQLITFTHVLSYVSLSVLRKPWGASEGRKVWWSIFWCLNYFLSRVYV